MYAAASLHCSYRIIFAYLVFIALGAIHVNIIINMNRGELSSMMTVYIDIQKLSTVKLVVNSISLRSFSSSNKDVMIVGLNPALQRTITVPSIKLGQVHRANNVEVGM